IKKESLVIWQNMMLKSINLIIISLNIYCYKKNAWSYGPFAVKRYETTKKIKFIFISQKCSKYCNLFRFHINSFLIFFGVSYLSTAKGPYNDCWNIFSG